ncbi:DUF4232 domain-containing protein [Streptomyces sp. NPDC002667]|uniref:DUF4232 domain-containing protein n=1 Tax=Streptomyces sp. NPDC002667 TaxID=3364657 RepID=UPI00368917BE
MIATNRRRPRATAPLGPAPGPEVRTVSLPARGVPARAAVLRRAWTRPLLLLCLAATVTSGCGLSAEIDRERDPGRTAVPDPVPSVVGTDAAHLPDPSGTSTDGSLVIEVPGPSPRPSPPKAVPTQAARGCPASGLRLGTGPADAAMGLRSLTLTLTDCGKRPYKVNGYPAVLHVLDRDGAPITGVHAVAGTDKVFMAPADPGPQPFTLHPGQSAQASVYWRMAAQDGTYLRIAPRKGQPAVTLWLPEPLDIGPENTLGSTPWTPVS